MAGLDSVLGNEQVRAYFRHAIESRKISHCYVIGGEDGLGKLTLANAFAQTLMCEASAGNPCMICHSCRQFLSGNHPDVIYPGHEKPTVFGVEDVRRGIVGSMLVRPYSSEYKIYIVDEAEKLSVQAQNALLKTIEEPPSYGILMLLTTNPAALLDTIRSRSIVLNMRQVDDEDLKAYLRDHGVEEGRIETIARFAQGNIGKAMRMSQSEDFSAMTKALMNLLKTADVMPFGELLEGLDKMAQYKLDMKDCLSFIRMWYRDVLLYKATNDPNIVIFKEEFSSIRKFASRYSYNGINRILEEIDITERRLDANVNLSISLEMLWMTIRDGCRG